MNCIDIGWQICFFRLIKMLKIDTPLYCWPFWPLEAKYTKQCKSEKTRFKKIYILCDINFLLAKKHVMSGIKGYQVYLSAKLTFLRHNFLSTRNFFFTLPPDKLRHINIIIASSTEVAEPWRFSCVCGLSSWYCWRFFTILRKKLFFFTSNLAKQTMFVLG